MTKRLLALLARGILLLLLFNTSTYASERRDAYEADFAFLVETLKARHPNPFFHMPEPAFRAELDAILEAVDTLDDFDAMMRLRIAMATLGDSHTSVGFYDQLDERGHFPLSFQWFEDGMYIIGATPAHEDLLGARLVAVGGKPLEMIDREMRSLVPASEPYFAYNRVSWLMGRAGLHQFFGTMAGDSAVFTLVMPDGTAAEKTVKADHEGYEETGFVYLSDRVGHPTWINPREDRLSVMFRDIFYEEDGLYLVQYNSCWGRELETRFGDAEAAASYPAFADFREKILARLRSGEVETLVFDLRANGGGSSPQGTRLIEEIAAIEKLQPVGRIYVAVSEATFSSAVINAMDFKEKTAAIFLGTPSGGRPNHYGEVRVFTLPNSNIEIAHSTNYFAHVDGDPAAVFPDVTIQARMADLMEGRDAVLDYVRGGHKDTPRTRH